MSEREDDLDELKEVNLFDKAQRISSKRTAVRYVRDDIHVSIIDFFGTVFDKKQKEVKLININSRGVLLQTKHKLSLNKKITLILKFNSGKEFKINGKIVNQTVAEKLNFYGVKFEHCHNELGDYLLETQQELIIS